MPSKSRYVNQIINMEVDYSKVWKGNMSLDRDWLTDSYCLFKREHVVTCSVRDVLERKSFRNLDVSYVASEKAFSECIADHRDLGYSEATISGIINVPPYSACSLSDRGTLERCGYLNTHRLKMLGEILKFDTIIGNKSLIHYILERKGVPVGIVMRIFEDDRFHAMFS